MLLSRLIEPLGHYFKFFLFILAVAFLERTIFALYHTHVSATLSFSEILYALIWGLKFDAAVAAFMSLFLFMLGYILLRVFKCGYQVTFPYLFSMAATVLVLLHTSDVMYFGESNRHLGYEVLEFSNSQSDLLLTALKDYTGMLLLQVSLLALLLWKVFRSRVPSVWISSERKKHSGLQHELSLPLVIVFSVLIVRGGPTGVPMEPLWAQQIGNIQQATLALNGAFNAAHFVLEDNQFKPVNIPLPDGIDVSETLASMYLESSHVSSQKVRKANVVMLFLESWAASRHQSYGGEYDAAPYFDSLREQGITSSAMVAGGHRTSEGMFSVLCSYQNPLGKTVAQTWLQSYQYRCLPHILRDNGYRSAFFQGSFKNTSGVGAFAQLLGFAEIYGKNDIEKPQYGHNSWGVYDQDLYEFAMEKMSSMQQPFLIGINTNTTHDTQLPVGQASFFNDDVEHADELNVLRFADIALERFIAEYKKRYTLENTIFVLVSDHTARVKGSSYENYHIPFVIYAPEIVSARFVGRTVSHRDIAPTLLDILSYTSEKWFTGKSMLRDNEQPYFADFYHNGHLGWIQNGILYLIPLHQPKNVRCFDHLRDPALTEDIECPETGDIVRQALSFTHRSQQLLAAGKTLSFPALEFQ